MTYVCPGLGHLVDGQFTKGIIFTSSFLYGMHNFFTILPKMKSQSNREILWGYLVAIASLPSMDTTSFVGAFNASLLFGNLYSDELQREKQIQTRTMNGAYFLLAAWIIIHTDLHITVLDNYVLKHFQHFYLNIFPEVSRQNSYSENRQASSRYEVAFTWSF